MKNAQIFFTSFLQIGCVAINTVLIAKGYVLGIFFASFTISMLWAFNVSKIALSDFKRKLIYSLGAGSGAVVGYYLINLIL